MIGNADSSGFNSYSISDSYVPLQIVSLHELAERGQSLERCEICQKQLVEQIIPGESDPLLSYLGAPREVRPLHAQCAYNWINRTLTWPGTNQPIDTESFGQVRQEWLEERDRFRWAPALKCLGGLVGTVALVAIGIISYHYFS